jgi:putative tricarboxylic transport membrane protein
MNLRDCWSSLFWLIVSLLVCIEAVRIGLGSFQVPGPGFLPFWAGIFVGSLAVMLIVINLRRREEREKRGRLWRGPGWRKVALVTTSLFAYGMILPRLGFLITTFGLMFLLFSVIERSRLWIRAASAVVTVLITYFAFSHWLGVPLPKGMLGF